VNAEKEEPDVMAEEIKFTRPPFPHVHRDLKLYKVKVERVWNVSIHAFDPIEAMVESAPKTGCSTLTTCTWRFCRRVHPIRRWRNHVESA
jgi:hypothetical protein